MNDTAFNTRRTFLKQTAVATAALATVRSTLGALAQTAATPRIRLGMDNFAVRAMGWKAPQLIDYAASLKLDTLFITDLDAYESLEDAALREVRKLADDKGVALLAGTWSICPTSKSFRNKWGTAEEHLATGIRVAKALGSPVIRVVLGSGDDRATPGGISARMADTVKVCKACRSRAMDAGVKIAVENHAGDMHSTELVRLIEDAGKDYVGANMDPGNAAWTLEDPVASLETLAPYALTTSIRDSAIWDSPGGATVQWTAVGEGQVNWARYMEIFRRECPQVAVNIETIGGFNRELAFLKPEFWKAWPDMKASDLSRFLALARAGKPRPGWQAPAGQDRKAAEQEFQKRELESSVRYCRETLGIGVRS